MLIKAAINGARTRSEYPAVPITPSEQAEEAAVAVAAGAGAVHVHIRGSDDVSHATGQVCIRGLNHQMIMIWHQTIGGHIDIKKISSLLKQIDNLLVISFLKK